MATATSNMMSFRLLAFNPYDAVVTPTEDEEAGVKPSKQFLVQMFGINDVFFKC